MRATFLTLALLLSGAAIAGSALTQVNADGLRSRLEAVAAEDHVVLLNFWATWCRPCLEEIPLFMELEQNYRDRGFRLIAVSLDEAESMESQVQPFMQKFFPDFSSLISVEYEMDDMVSVVDNGWNEVLPTSYLLDKNGNVAERLQGTYTRDEFAARIEALLPQ